MFYFAGSKGMATNDNTDFVHLDQDSNSLDSEKALNLALLEQDQVKNVPCTKWNNSLPSQLFGQTNLTPVSSPSSNNHSPTSATSQTMSPNPMAYAAALAATGNQSLPLSQLAQVLSR